MVNDPLEFGIELLLILIGSFLIAVGLAYTWPRMLCVFFGVFLVARVTKASIVRRFLIRGPTTASRLSQSPK